jgi:aryl-alcohol dehydrogenase-like predicted oxidoreductase
MTRPLFPGFDVPPLTLGGAPLGGIDELEAQAILRLAAESGISLVDTSSAYGASEAVIGSCARAAGGRNEVWQPL